MHLAHSIRFWVKRKRMAIVSEPKSRTLINENGREDNNKEYDKNHQESPLSSAPHPPHGGFLLCFSKTLHRHHHTVSLLPFHTIQLPFP